MDFRILRILLVEDQVDRQEILKKLCKKHAWVLAHTAQRACRLLQAYDFDLIFLDYDLAGSTKGDEVAKCLVDLKKAPSLVIHSMSSIGAEKISKIYPSAKWIPISKIIKDNASFKKFQKRVGERFE